MDQGDDRKSGTFFVKGEKIVLKRDGTWMADGIEITHEQTRALFYRAIAWDAAARSYCLSVGYETIHIEVEDAPYFVTGLEAQSTGAPIAVLADTRHIAIDANRLKYDAGTLYLELGDGQRAKFLSAPYYDLMRGLQEDETHYFVAIAGKRAELAGKNDESPLSRGRPSKKDP